ncbi:MAG TPA: hypothetical protein VGQ83_29390 [Polyangia bacterium]|jgi:hypothetical protein
MSAPGPGQVIAGQYRIVRKLGEGDVGATFEAVDGAGGIGFALLR